MQIDKDVIAIIISIFSLILSLFLRYVDLKKAEKTRREDLCNVEKQFNHLEEQNKSLQKQATSSEKHVNFLLKTKEELDLGPPLQFNVHSPTPDKHDPNKFSVILYIKNPTERMIKINHIWIEKKCQFEFDKIVYSNGTFISGNGQITINPTSPKHIDLIKLETEQTLQNGLNSFNNIIGGQEIKLEFFICSSKLNKSDTPLFIMEHTSSSNPQKTIKASFWTYFLSPHSS
ncbi:MULTISPECIES: hypothetical protein [unclassified Bartonella]|uniref:hypothetical protein n=1 Tax=unclassified Bartonella TaxID=2645622 RepID=UPI0023624D3B|nr:hypothetical protein [Bartonella sp. CM31XJBT]